MEALKSSFLYTIPFNTPSSSKLSSKPDTIVCSVSPDPWSLSDGNNKNLNNPKPKSKNPKNPLSDDNARRIIKAKAQYLSALRRNQGSQAQTPNWIKRTPEQMVHYLEDDKNGHLYGKHVVAAIKKVRSLSGKPNGSYDMRKVMASFVAKLTFREMCVVLKEQKGWRQVSDFFAWMKLQLSYRPSVIVYTVVLRAYGQVGKIKLAEQTFLEMLEVGCEPDEVACGTMLCAYARWGRHKAMLSFYSAVHERGITLSTSVYNFMLSSLQKKSVHVDVLYMWRQMIDEKVPANHFTYTVVISSLVKEGMSEEALNIFNEMKNLGIVPEEATYSLLISLNSKSGNRDEAFCLYEDMRSRGIVPSNFTCASLLALYCRNGDYSKALSLFSEMEKYGIAADEVIYGLLIRIYGKLGLYEDAERTFNDIEKLGLLKSDKTYTTMARVHLHSGNVEKALVIIEQMKSRNILLPRYTLIILLRCYAVKKDLASAEATFQALSTTGNPDCGSFNDLLTLYMTLGLMEKARDLILRIRKDQVVFDEELLKTVMKLYCREGMQRDVQQLLEELKTNKRLEDSAFFQALLVAMRGVGHHLSLDQPGAAALELVLLLCLADGNGKRTEGKLKLLLQTANGLPVASQLLRKLAKEGELSKAEYLYELLVKLGNRLDDSACASMISSYAKKQRLKQAQQVFTAMDSSSTRKSLYPAMMEAYCKWGKEMEGYLFYKGEADKGHDMGPVAISLLVNSLTNCGKHHEAAEVVNNSLRLNVELDTVAYNTFIKAMLEAGKLHFASSIYERMLSSGVAPSIQTHNTMISVYGRHRNLDKAVEIFNTAQSMGMPMDEKAYTNLIFYYGKAGKSHKASLLFDEMQKGGIKPGKVSYNIMMSIYGAGGLHHEAAELFQQMRCDGFSPDSNTYLSLIRAYKEGLEYFEAERVINLMRKEGIPPSCAHFNELLLAYGKAGLVEAAERTYKELIKTGLIPDVECNRAMFRGYVDYGRVTEGISFFERISGSVEPDRFIMSAAVHLFKLAGMECRAEEMLKSMSDIGIPFLEKLEVGCKKKNFADR